ncbi:hypothetical protein LINPERPRIM_LOCUS40678 [Linum perenne]
MESKASERKNCSSTYGSFPCLFVQVPQEEVTCRPVVVDEAHRVYPAHWWARVGSGAWEAGQPNDEPSQARKPTPRC